MRKENILFFCVGHTKKEARIRALGRRTQRSRGQRRKKKNKSPQEGLTPTHAASPPDNDFLFFRVAPCFSRFFLDRRIGSRARLSSRPILGVYFLCGEEGRLLGREKQEKKSSGRRRWRSPRGRLTRWGLFSSSSSSAIKTKRNMRQRATAICLWRLSAPKSGPHKRSRKISLPFSEGGVYVYFFSSLSLCFRATWDGRWHQRRACQRCRCRPC